MERSRARIPYEDLDETTAAVFAALEAANDPQDPREFFFVSGGRLSRLVRTPTGQLAAELLTDYRLRHRLAETMVFLGKEDRLKAPRWMSYVTLSRLRKRRYRWYCDSSRRPF